MKEVIARLEADIKLLDQDIPIVKRITEKFRSILEDVNALSIGGVLTLERDIKWDTYDGVIEKHVKNSEGAEVLLNKERERLTKSLADILKREKEKAEKEEAEKNKKD